MEPAPSKRLGAFSATACLAFVLWAGATPALAAPVATKSLSGADAGSTADYWTPERMRAADPIELELPLGLAPETAPRRGGGSDAQPLSVGAVAPRSAVVEELLRGTVGAEPAPRSGAYTRSQVANPSEQQVRSHGKIFLTIRGGREPGDYFCSGTALSSNNRSVVWTAGHCVFDTFGGGFASNWLFVPAFQGGAAPFGEWTARKLAAPEEWRRRGNLKYDLGAAVVRRDEDGSSLTEVVGGRGIAFNQARTQSYQSFGYPSESPPAEFTGGREFRCNSGLGGTDNPGGPGPSTSWIGCDMTAGSSGGGWVAAGNVLSVNSYSYCTLLLGCEERLYGPYQGPVAEDLYRSVAGEASFCMGKLVTRLGTKGDDRLVGTDGRDVFKTSGGDDKISARGSNDIICAGSGDDKIRGQGGNDMIKGQRGNDRMIGGPDRDTCNGGSGRNKAFGCEVRKRAG